MTHLVPRDSVSDCSDTSAADQRSSGKVAMLVLLLVDGGDFLHRGGSHDRLNLLESVLRNWIYGFRT